MYQRILVAYDGSSHANVALRQGAELARLCDAELHMVGIVAVTPYLAMGDGFTNLDIWAGERAPVEDALEKASKTLSEQGVKVTFDVREGNPAHEIAACAADKRSDLVVIGHSDKGMFARWFEGSVGANLIRDLPCNLLVAAG